MPRWLSSESRGRSDLTPHPPFPAREGGSRTSFSPSPLRGGGRGEGSPPSPRQGRHHVDCSSSRRSAFAAAACSFGVPPPSPAASPTFLRPPSRRTPSPV